MCDEGASGKGESLNHRDGERGCHGGVSELIAINRRPLHSVRGGHRIGLPGANTPVCVRCGRHVWKERNSYRD